jgi:hypothetical protein
MVRGLLLFALLAGGCHGAKQTGPTWPAPSKTADDGGESIAPRTVGVASSLERAEDVKHEDVDDEEKVPDAPKPAASTSGDKPAEPSSQPVIDDVIMTDEVIIEIDD